MRTRLLVTILPAALVLAACGSPDDPGPSPSSPPPSPARADGAVLLHRPGGRTSAQNPAFSPDGKSLLFTVFHDGYNEGAAALRTLPFRGDAAREKPRTVLDEHDRAAVNLPGASWHPSAGLTFTSDRAGRDEVWTLEPGSGRKPVRVTEHDGDTGYLEPSFSPDGRWIAFQESKQSQESPEGTGDSGGEGSIWKIRRDGTHRTRLLDGPATRTDNRQPNWSPKGGRLVLQRRERGRDWALYVMNADGTGLRGLTDVPGEHTDPSWSPDGKSVVFSSTAGGLDLPQVFVVPAAGGKPVRVTRDPKSYDGAPSWSPDGKWIAFESHPGDEDRPSTLWRVPAPRR
ncbi:PD40 domain-containing protein [Streptomyces sp. AV19]|uniref:PD40 domain-containing protein n=1 Tax=Streptomyces sp. AV19 TaxID=2793068 RepID=UPI0018FEC017|nr:PD40 domain-containing protein [Streptomyces sp. AV19]MBH1934472.1 PD40 domain-containing protein [Streptomyces sp. AV19]MDG4533264.1 PD40 domain-containing protein [Streptomyces sp. AV19]